MLREMCRKQDSRQISFKFGRRAVKYTSNLGWDSREDRKFRTVEGQSGGGKMLVKI